MRTFQPAPRCVLLLSMFLCAAALGLAQEESSTEITGYYQQYRDFSFNPGSGFEDLGVPSTSLTGGGVSVAQNLVPWFALWSQVTFYGSVGQEALRARVINNLQGLRWQTKNYGPIRFYGKGGVGFSHVNFKDIGGEYKLSVAYGGGAHVWATEWIGVNLDLSHVVMGLPNLTDREGRDKWDSGLTYTLGLTVRF